MGPMLTAADVRVFGAKKKSSHLVPEESRLIGFDVDGSIHYPAFQFDDDGSPLSWVAHVVAALPDSDTTLQFFGAARPALHGKSYAALLLDGPPDDALVSAILDDVDRIASAEKR